MLRARKRNPAVFTALLFGLIAYLPVSGIVALNATAAEHWIYLPSAFFFLAIALEIVELGQKLKSPRSTVATTTLVLGVVWMAFLGARTFARTFDWKDQRTFLERTIAHGGDSARMLINLGGLELTEGKLEDAAVHLHAALQKKPNQPLAIINLAAVALKQKDFKLARELLTRATQMPLVDAQAHQLLAALESKEGGKVDLMRMRLAARTGPPNLVDRKTLHSIARPGWRNSGCDQRIAHLPAITVVPRGKLEVIERSACETRAFYPSSGSAHPRARL